MSIPSLISAEVPLLFPSIVTFKHSIDCAFSGSCNYEEKKFYKYGAFNGEDPSKYFSRVTSQGTDTCGGAWTDTAVYSIEGNGNDIPFKVTIEYSHQGEAGHPPNIGQNGENAYGPCDSTSNTTYSNPVDGVYFPTGCGCVCPYGRGGDPEPEVTINSPSNLNCHNCPSPNINYNYVGQGFGPPASSHEAGLSRIAYISDHLNTATSFNLNSYGASAVKSMNLQIVHEPSPTCYFKAWVGLETYPVLAANGGTFFEWTRGANRNFTKLGPYVWDKRGGDCPSPSSLYRRPETDVIIGSTIYSPSAGENTAVYLVIYKTSLFPNYEPDDPAGWQG